MNENRSSEFEDRVRTNASTFHQNFSRGEFEKNGPLVAEDIYVNSNNAILIGRENFVNRIKRYNGPFPGLQLKDRIVLVEGDVAAVHYILQGRHLGPFGNIPASGHQIEAMGAEFFTMDKNAMMKDLLTITQSDRLMALIKGEIKVDQFEEVTLLPIATKDAAFKSLVKEQTDSYVAFYNARKWEKLEGLLHENLRVNWNGEMGSGKSELLQRFKDRLAPFPDLTFQLDRKVVEGERSAISYTMIGKQTGVYSHSGINVSPTGKTIRVREAQHLQFDGDGKITGVITISNGDDFAEQLK